MATSHALCISELVLRIVEHLHAELPTSRPALARIAQVNRLFHGVAVPFLWADMPNIEPLFKVLSNCVNVAGNAGRSSYTLVSPCWAFRQICLASDSKSIMLGYHIPFGFCVFILLYLIGRSSSDVYCAASLPFIRLVIDCSFFQTLQGPMNNEEIDRLKEYARHIRVLDIPRPKYSASGGRSMRTKGIALDPHSLEKLLRRTGLPLLPSLTKLKLFPVTPPYLSDPVFLLSPSLRELTVSFPNCAVSDIKRGISTVFSVIFAGAPRLTHLWVQSESYMFHDSEDTHFHPWMPDPGNDWMFEGPNDPDSLGEVFCDALAVVTTLHDLEVFSMITMTTGLAGRNLIQALSSLPRLISCSFGINISSDILPTLTPGFSRLRVLAISNVTREAEMNLFNSPGLRDLTVYHPDYTNPALYPRMVELVVQRFSALRRLRWALGHQDMGFATRILPDIVPPFFDLYDLQELYVNVSDRWVVDDDISLLVEGLGQRLVRLELGFCRMEKVGPTARSLLTLAQGCPSLRILYLGGLFITQEDEAHVGTCPVVGHPLRHLDIGDLRCEGEVFGAMIIDMLFPFLDIPSRRHQQGTGAAQMGQWSRVLDRLEAYHAEREVRS